MTVQSVRKRYSQRTGRVAITFEVDGDTWRCIVRSAENSSAFGPLDGLAGSLNMMIMGMKEPLRLDPLPDDDTDL